jgi:hypothetical protein
MTLQPVLGREDVVEGEGHKRGARGRMRAGNLTARRTSGNFTFGAAA